MRHGNFLGSFARFRTSARASGIPARAAAPVLVVLLALLLAPGEARAGAVCSNTPGSGDRVSCSQGSGVSTDLDIDLSSVTISTSGTYHYGVYGTHAGSGGINIDMSGGSIATTGTNGEGIYGNHSGTGGIDIDAANVAITVTGASSRGILGYHSGASGDMAIGVRGGSIATSGAAGPGIFALRAAGTGDLSISLSEGARVSTATNNAYAVFAEHRGAGAIDINLNGAEVSTADPSYLYAVFGFVTPSAGAVDASIAMTGGAVRTAGSFSYGVFVYHQGPVAGEVDIALSGGAEVSTKGSGAHGVYGRRTHSSGGGVDVNLNDAVILTEGPQALGVHARLNGTASPWDVSIDASGGSVTTRGRTAYGVYALQQGLGAVSVTTNGVAVSTEGASARGVYAWAWNAAGAGDVAVAMTGGSVRTAGDAAYGVRGANYGAGAVSVTTNGVAVSTKGAAAHGVYGWIRHASSEADIAIAVTGGSVAAEGLNARAIYGRGGGLGSIGVTTGAGARIKSIFHAGATAFLTNDANAEGRLLINHGGAVEALDAGVLAWAQRSSGHTFGEGAETADDAARTDPMIHVTSSGDAVVGRAVTDAFIRSEIAGEDGALSAVEAVVLSAIEGGDSDALEAALDALPDSYDDAYRAQARSLLTRAASEPEDAALLANQAAAEILGFSRAGVRAVALNHEEIANHVRSGDALSDAERTVLAAILTGGGLEAALAALPAEDYSDAWKDGVRRRAATYNAGGIRVDLTGGSIDAEGNGAEALYAVPHDGNGAIAVSVARGASVSGGRNGLYLSGAGAGEDGFRAQSVSVDGAVAGGTGAGVYMKGGGRLVVGASGRISAASGLGVLSDGPGNFRAEIAGRVAGDLRGMGAGEHSVTVSRGGEVSGTIHLAASDVTLEGAAGRVRLDRGGTVTVGAAGRIAGGDHGAVEFLGGDSSRLRFGLSLPPARRVRDVLGGDAWITNDGGGTDIYVNGVKLHDAERGSTGLTVRVGARDVSVAPSEIILGRNFHRDDFHDEFAPRAGLYEALPALLAQLAGAGAGRAGEEALSFPDSSVWTRASGARGSGSGDSTTGAKRDFDRFEAEAGARAPLLLTKGLSAWGLVRFSEVSADVETPGSRGGMELDGLGFGGGLSWRSEDGWYVSGGLLNTDYSVDFSSKSAGALKNDADAVVRVWEVEAGRRGAFRSAAFSFTPRVWLTRSRTTIDSFTDSTGTTFSFAAATRLTAGVGAVAETLRPLSAGGGQLGLRGSLDVGGILNGARTTVEVSGQRLHSDAEQTRFLLGLGARWRAERFSMDAALSADGVGTGEKIWDGRLSLGVRF